ncbi:MAG TPA: hypothetical protein VF885_23240 [Arthrobacter sp.]
MSEAQTEVIAALLSSSPTQIKFLEKIPLDGTDLMISPFESSPEFYDRWWRVGQPVYESSRTVLNIQGVLCGYEIARALVVDDRQPVSEAYGVPFSTQDFLEISFFETAQSVRRRGVGTKVVQMIRQELGDRPMIAFSEDADPFWASLGWERFEHENGRNRPLFICR